MMRDPAEIIQILSGKVDRCLTGGIEPKALLISNEDYTSLKEWLMNMSGITGNPDRIRLTIAGKSYPLYIPDPEKVSIRTGQPTEPMVVF
jgi:hypothetical protein